MIYFLVAHVGPVEHFIPFSEALEEAGYSVCFLACNPAAQKLREKQIPCISIDGLEAEEVAQLCQGAGAILTDVGHPLSAAWHRVLPSPHYAYYDNPESSVPGGYSEMAMEAIALSDGVLFANSTLAHTLSLSVPAYGIGFYPMSEVDVVKKMRGDPVCRARFFAQLDIEDTGQKVLVYFGGNNPAYFEKAFPAFLSIIEEARLENHIVILHQHPGARCQNVDKRLFQQLKRPAYVSAWDSIAIQAVADYALYYQTSMAARFVLAGIPTIQVGHAPYEDLLVRHKIISTASTTQEFLESLRIKHLSNEENLLALLGYKASWKRELIRSLTN